MEQESKVNQAKYVELNLFPEEKEDHQKDSISSEDMESETSPDKEYDLTDLFERLSKSAFRSRFHLSKKDKEYIAEKGLATIRKHAEDFVAKRLAPAVIPNDGKQTPMRGLLYSLPSMLQAAVAVVVSSNGIIYLPEDS